MKIKELIENKNVLFYGDSITHNWLRIGHNLEHISDTDKFSGYVGFIDEDVKTKHIENKAISGGCFASTTYLNELRQEYRHFNYQIDHSLEELKKADVIFVFFGTNDYSEQVMFGKNDDRRDDNHSFYAGMNNGFDKIKEYNPKARVFVLTMLKRTYPIDGKQPYCFSIEEYNLAIRECIREHNLELIDAYNAFEYNTYNEYSDDGLHPNVKGQRVLADFILNYEVK